MIVKLTARAAWVHPRSRVYKLIQGLRLSVYNNTHVQYAPSESDGHSGSQVVSDRQMEKHLGLTMKIDGHTVYD